MTTEVFSFLGEGGAEASWAGMPRLLRVNAREFAVLAETVHRRFGICLSEGQENFLSARLRPVLERSGCREVSEFIDLLRNDRSGMWESELANAVTTQHTSFFREPEHFDFLLSEALPELCDRKRRAGDFDLRIWSAACATGAEPYSIVMTVKTYFGSEYGRWTAGALATDISDAALAKARQGRYNGHQFAAVPRAYRHYFAPYDEDSWELSEEVRREVTFRRFNLMEPALPFRRAFDMIFCRNVTLYFDGATRDDLTRRLFGATTPGGYLIIGHSETIDRERTPFEYVRPSIYRRSL